MASHGINQKKPSVPAVRTAKRQPNALASQAIRGGARIAPTLDPLSNIATARPRSRAGNHSATVLLAPGQLNPSPAPSKKRRSEEHTSELQSRLHLVCRLLLEKKKKKNTPGNRLGQEKHKMHPTTS